MNDNNEPLSGAQKGAVILLAGIRDGLLLAGIAMLVGISLIRPDLLLTRAAMLVIGATVAAIFACAHAVRSLTNKHTDDN